MMMQYHFNDMWLCATMVKDPRFVKPLFPWEQNRFSTIGLDRPMFTVPLVLKALKLKNGMTFFENASLCSFQLSTTTKNTGNVQAHCESVRGVKRDSLCKI